MTVGPSWIALELWWKTLVYMAQRYAEARIFFLGGARDVLGGVWGGVLDF